LGPDKANTDPFQNQARLRPTTIVNLSPFAALEFPSAPSAPLKNAGSFHHGVLRKSLTITFYAVKGSPLVDDRRL
jgi:hypothetical protein